MEIYLSTSNIDVTEIDQLSLTFYLTFIDSLVFFNFMRQQIIMSKHLTYTDNTYNYLVLFEASLPMYM